MGCSNSTPAPAPTNLEQSQTLPVPESSAGAPGAPPQAVTQAASPTAAAETSAAPALNEREALTREAAERTFRQIDADGNGGLDAFELHDALTQLGFVQKATQTHKILAHFDDDNNQTLELDEFLNLIECLRVFRAVDADGNGSIDEDELEGALSLVGLSVDKKQTTAILGKFDVGGKGYLEIDEFAGLVRFLQKLENEGIGVRVSVVEEKPAAEAPESWMQQISRRISGDGSDAPSDAAPGMPPPDAAPGLPPPATPAPPPAEAPPPLTPTPTQKVRRLSEFLNSGSTGFTPRANNEYEYIDGLGKRVVRKRDDATNEMVNFLKDIGVSVKN